MKCPRCQQETPADAEFCPECGAKLSALCAQCGTANAPGHKFCKKCGQPLGVPGAQGPEAPRLTPHPGPTPPRPPGAGSRGSSGEMDSASGWSTLRRR